jgi:hypothetical protein
MTNSRRILSRPRGKDDLDLEFLSPGTHIFAPLFNDDGFVPHENDTLCHGITATDIAGGIDPSRREHVRYVRTLADKWAKLKTSYTNALERFQRSGQQEADVFPTFANGHCVVCIFMLC